MYHALVPIFFVTMGMLVDFGAMLPVLAFGSVVTLLAIVGKVAGCAAPALLVGFNRMGATRIGLGMLPRGEVALIIAGAGLTSGTITSDIFGVAVLMTIVTTVLAPVLLVPSFKRGGSGLRTATTRLPAPGAAEAGRHLFSLPDGLVTLWTKHLEAALGARGFQKLGELHDPATYSVVEYHRGERFLSVQVRPKREGRSEVVVEADAPEWQALIAAAVQEATCEAVEELAQTLAARERP